MLRTWILGMKMKYMIQYIRDKFSILKFSGTLVGICIILL